MARLKERNRQIPNGLKFKCAPLHFQSSNWHSFDRIVRDVFTKIRSNPALARKHNLPDTLQGVEDMVDAYNAMICEQNGWLDYIVGGPDHPDSGPPVPKAIARQQSQGFFAKLAAAGALVDWLGTGAEPVDTVVAERRVQVCVNCPMNSHDEPEQFFTQQAASTLRRMIAFAHQQNLKTSLDDKLGICTGCGCSLKLKPWVRLAIIEKHTTQEQYNELDPNCWMLSERKGNPELGETTPMAGAIPPDQ